MMQSDVCRPEMHGRRSRSPSKSALQAENARIIAQYMNRRMWMFRISPRLSMVAMSEEPP